MLTLTPDVDFDLDFVNARIRDGTGIEANPEKCAAILAMRSPATVKEVQQLTGRMAALSRFVSASGEKGHPYFQCLRRNNRFV